MYKIEKTKSEEKLIFSEKFVLQNSKFQFNSWKKNKNFPCHIRSKTSPGEKFHKQFPFSGNLGGCKKQKKNKNVLLLPFRLLSRTLSSVIMKIICSAHQKFHVIIFSSSHKPLSSFFSSNNGRKIRKKQQKIFS